MIRGFSSDPSPERGEDPPSWDKIWIVIGTGIGGPP